MMADDALMRKEAEMGRLTREEIVAAWNGAVPESKDKGIDMYLHLMQAVADAQYRKCALSLESVREEVRNAALEEAAMECGLCASHQGARHDQKVRDQTRRDLAAAIRALQHAPARVAEGRSDLVQVSRTFLESLTCPMCDGSGWINTTGPDPVHDGCPWCEARDRFLAGEVPSAPESPAKEQPMDQENEDRETMRRDFERGVYEREGKEQPGEQNAAPQVNSTGRRSSPAAAAPDVAAMVKRLESLYNLRLPAAGGQILALEGGRRITAPAENFEVLREAAALIEKLGQGWIPVAWRLVNKNGQHIQWAKTYSFDPSEGGNDAERIAADQKHLDGFPHNWQPLYILPPPPERP